MKGLFAYLDSNMKFTALELLLFSEIVPVYHLTC